MSSHNSTAHEEAKPKQVFKQLFITAESLRTLKIQAASEGRSMRGIVEELIDKYVEEKKSHVA